MQKRAKWKIFKGSNSMHLAYDFQPKRPNASCQEEANILSNVGIVTSVNDLEPKKSRITSLCSKTNPGLNLPRFRRIEF